MASTLHLPSEPLEGKMSTSPHADATGFQRPRARPGRCRLLAAALAGADRRLRRVGPRRPRRDRRRRGRRPIRRVRAAKPHPRHWRA